MITNECKNILLADDAAFFRNKLSAILVEVGHMVRFAVNGAEVIEDLKVSYRSTDLLILDLQMPEVDGFGVIEWMHENDLLDKVPVLIITGAYDHKEIFKKLSPFNVTEVMTKAFTPEQVVYRVNKLLFGGKEDIRREERIPVSIPADFMTNDNNKAQTGFILNVTGDGLFLHSRETLQRDSLLKIKFLLPGSESLIEVVGLVQWSSSAMETSGLFQGSGILFTTISEKDQERIREFVKVERERIFLKE